MTCFQDFIYVYQSTYLSLYIYIHIDMINSKIINLIKSYYCFKNLVNNYILDYFFNLKLWNSNHSKDYLLYIIKYHKTQNSSIFYNTSILSL